MAKRVRIGQLDQRITFQSETSVSDGAGGFEDGWSDIASAPTVPAKVEETPSGNERDDAGRLSSVTSYTVTIRNRSDLDAAMRIIWSSNGDLELNIRALPDPGPRALYRTLICEAGVAS